MRIDTFSGGRFTNKTTRYHFWQDPRVDRLPSRNEDGSWSRKDRAPIPVDKVDAYFAWLETCEPHHGSTKAERCRILWRKNAKRVIKKQEKRATLQCATIDTDLRDAFPRSMGFRRMDRIKYMR